MKCVHCTNGRVQLFLTNEECEFCGGTGQQPEYVPPPGSSYGGEAKLHLVTDSAGIPVAFTAKELLESIATFNPGGHQCSCIGGEVNGSSQLTLRYTFHPHSACVVSRMVPIYVACAELQSGVHNHVLKLQNDIPVIFGDILNVDWKIDLLTGFSLPEGVLSC